MPAERNRPMSTTTPSPSQLRGHWAAARGLRLTADVAAVALVANAAGLTALTGTPDLSLVALLAVVLAAAALAVLTSRAWNRVAPAGSAARASMATVDRAIFLLRDVAMAAAGVAIVARTGHVGEVIVGLVGAGALVLCAAGMGLRMARRGIPTGWDLAVQMSSLLPWAVWTAVGDDQGVHLGLTLGWLPVVCWLLARIVQWLRATPTAQPAI